MYSGNKYRNAYKKRSKVAENASQIGSGLVKHQKSFAKSGAGTANKSASVRMNQGTGSKLRSQEIFPQKPRKQVQYKTALKIDRNTGEKKAYLERKPSTTAVRVRTKSRAGSQEMLMRSAEKGGVSSSTKKQTTRYLSDDPIIRRELGGRSRSGSYDKYVSKTSRTGRKTKNSVIKELNKRYEKVMRNK